MINWVLSIVVSTMVYLLQGYFDLHEGGDKFGGDSCLLANSFFGRGDEVDELVINASNIFMHKLLPASKSDECSLYSYPNAESDLLKVFVSSTKESRKIVNDPFVYGLEYTEYLKIACTKTLKSLMPVLPEKLSESFSEDNTCVLNILRGGLNFCLREALGSAFNWNKHSTAFLSAQRERQQANPEDWYITENNYKKVYLPKNGAIVLGDVVATGTSLEFALNELLTIAEKEGQDITSILFFTIGGPRSHEILNEFSMRAKNIFPNYVGAVVVYFEGCFSVATADTPVSIKFTGTDLLRRDAVLTPEFVASQFENPFYPIERCTIYDAGSRAFCLAEYLEDVKDYYEKTLKLAEEGTTYKDLLLERFPELQNDFNSSGISLVDICKNQLSKF